MGGGGGEGEEGRERGKRGKWGKEREEGRGGEGEGEGGRSEGGKGERVREKVMMLNVLQYLQVLLGFLGYQHFLGSPKRKSVLDPVICSELANYFLVQESLWQGTGYEPC